MLVLSSGVYKYIASDNKSFENFIAEIPVENQQHRSALIKFLNNRLGNTSPEIVRASVSWSQFFQLQRAGFNPAVEVEIERSKLIDSQFYAFKEINKLIAHYKKAYPDIVHVEQIGQGSVKGLPIWAIKISDYPEQRENEPAILFTGGHHAKELLGVQVCMHVLQQLCNQYSKNNRVTDWIDNYAIWIVPVVNPDGYQLVMDEDRSPEFWRKNLRDNNGNGRFDPSIDGVDINRNYDFNWEDESDNDPRSWYYRGPYPFSEKESQAIRDFAFREHFVAHLDYHSYGEVILYPWDNFTEPPDIDFIIALANDLARVVKRNKSIDHYGIRPLNGRLGQSSVWMRARAAALSFIVEVGDSHFPKAWRVPAIVENSAKTAYYMLDRLGHTAVKGVVRNAYNQQPIMAEIEINRYSSSIVENPSSDDVTGFYYRIVEPGSYRIMFSAPGFRSKVVHNVIVDNKKVTTLNIELFPVEEMFPTAN